jgi:RNA polymerase sigma-70 factor (ECF subfamily)
MTPSHAWAGRGAVGEALTGEHAGLSEVRTAFLSLSQEHREVLLLVAMEGLQYDEAARILQMPIGTVRFRLSRAREALRRGLETGRGALAQPHTHRAAALSP